MCFKLIAILLIFLCFSNRKRKVMSNLGFKHHITVCYHVKLPTALSK